MRAQVIAMYSRSWHSWDKCRLLPNVHALRTLDNWYGSSARQDVSCVPLMTDCYLCTCPLPLPLNRCHATIATASNCRASASASSRLWVFARVTQQSGEIRPHGCRRLPSHPAHHRSRQECFPPRKRLCQSIP